MRSTARRLAWRDWRYHSCAGERGALREGRRQRGAIAAIGLLALLLAACTALTGPAPTAFLRVAAPRSLASQLAEVAEAFSARQPEISIQIDSADAALAVEMLRRGEVEIAAMTWLPPDLPATWTATPVAWDAVVLIVHADNPLPGLTMLQARRVFAGWAWRWGDVGGIPFAPEESEPIQVVSREEGAGTRAFFEQQVMGEEAVTLTALVIPNSSAVVDYVASHRNAIGYVSMGEVDARVRVVPLEGVTPTPETVSASGYHLAHPVYLVTRQRSAAVRSFVDFVLSPGGQALLGARYGRVR